MQKLSDKIRTRARTGQTMGPPGGRNVVYSGPPGVPPITVAWQPGQPPIVTEHTPGSNGGPACGPTAPTTPMSWGAGCPPGHCTSQDLAAALNRSFAGEKYPCRELTYWIGMIADAAGVASFEDNSKVTICPTRIAVFSTTEPDAGMFVSEFEIGNQNQLVGDGIPIGILSPDSYQIIPYVTDCIKAGIPFSVSISGMTADDVLYFGLIGPTIG